MSDQLATIPPPGKNIFSSKENFTQLKLAGTRRRQQAMDPKLSSRWFINRNFVHMIF